MLSVIPCSGGRSKGVPFASGVLCDISEMVDGGHIEFREIRVSPHWMMIFASSLV